MMTVERIRDNHSHKQKVLKRSHEMNRIDRIALWKAYAHCQYMSLQFIFSWILTQMQKQEQIMNKFHNENTHTHSTNSITHIEYRNFMRISKTEWNEKHTHILNKKKKIIVLLRIKYYTVNEISFYKSCR